jgi:hypothetical protein
LLLAKKATCEAASLQNHDRFKWYQAVSIPNIVPLSLLNSLSLKFFVQHSFRFFGTTFADAIREKGEVESVQQRQNVIT